MARAERAPSDSDRGERWLTLYEVAGRFLARPETVQAWVRDGSLPAEDRERLAYTEKVRGSSPLSPIGLPAGPRKLWPLAVINVHSTSGAQLIRSASRIGPHPTRPLSE